MTKSEMSKTRLTVPHALQRSHPALRDAGLVDETAQLLVAALAKILGASDLDEKEILDVGCGVKLTRAIINHELPIGHYTGLDVDAAVIGFLTEAVHDDRFSFHRIDVHNERYNSEGPPLDGSSAFGIGEHSTDLDAITGYSLFTHLNPGDYLQMARMMREEAASETRLVITTYLDRQSDGGHGFIDVFSEGAGASMVGMAKGGYLDVFPDNPLNVTLYDDQYARELLERAGWRITEILDPTSAAQHTIVAAAN